MNLRFVVIISLLFFTSLQVLASGNTHSVSGDHEIPVKVIIYQTINVSILFAGLFYFLKKPVKNFFLEKKTQYILAAEKAQSAKFAAEQENLAIQVKLTKLESTADESIMRARAEAADLKNNLVNEAQLLSQRIKLEAENAAKNEIEKAKNKIREELIIESMKLARTQVKTIVSKEDHRRLQNEFIESINAVQP